MFRALLIALSVMILIADKSMAQTHKGYEMPPYSIERSEGPFELRRYESHVVAEVSVQGERSETANQGFRILAGYIFGGNEASDKIAMTVPVAQAPKGGGVWTVRFMMPRQYDLTSLPKPNNAAIRLLEQPPQRQVAVSFTGLRSDSALAQQESALRGWASGLGLTLTDGPHYYFYDGPTTLPWNRRNEVAFGVR
jgi:hypothetical protein